MRTADEIRSEFYSALFLVTSGLPRLLGDTVEAKLRRFLKGSFGWYRTDSKPFEVRSVGGP